METTWILNLIKIFIALSIINVWFIRFNRPTAWRGGSANSMLEEFKAYGLSKTTMYIIGGFKVLFALLLLVSIWYPELTSPAAGGMAILMAGAVSMHIRVKDPIKKSFPAFSFMLLSLLLVFFNAL